MNPALTPEQFDAILSKYAELKALCESARVEAHFSTHGHVTIFGDLGQPIPDVAGWHVRETATDNGTIRVANNGRISVHLPVPA